MTTSANTKTPCANCSAELINYSLDPPECFSCGAPAPRRPTAPRPRPFSMRLSVPLTGWATVRIEIDIPDMDQLSVEDAKFIEGLLRAVGDRVPIRWKRS